MKANKSARKYRSPIISNFLNEITPVEKMQASTKMILAARLDDILTARGWGKKEFAEKVNKNPSEITKWLSGTQNFTIDTLSEIAVALGMSVAELFVPNRIQLVSDVKIVIKVEDVEPAFFSRTGAEDLVSHSYYNMELHHSWIPLTADSLA